MPVRSIVMFVVLCLAGSAVAQDRNDALLRPKAHIAIKDPKKISATEAEQIYRSLIGELSDMYALSQDPSAKKYLNWRRYNTGPYLSATHGNRYVNNYANAKANDYGASQPVPVGAIFAKDSFTVTKEGKLYGGALFLMEKLPAGVSRQTADWRYWMILPDGSVLGDSEDDSARAMEFCHTCHKIVARKDYLYFVPKAYRK